MKLTTFTDGGSRGNPGPSAIGVVIKNQKNEIVFQLGKCIGHGTNNEAEYLALIEALKNAYALGATEVECIMDSKLVAEQLNRNWKIKEPRLQKLFVEAWNAAAKFKKTVFRQVPRELNKEPDKLLNKALDGKL